MSDAFDKVVFRGRLMDKKTQAFLLAMEAELGYELTVMQGSYNPGGVGASAGTHDRGGVVDLAPYDGARKVRVARKLGGFAWFREDLPGVWGEHVHLGIRNHGNLAAAALSQQRDYDADPARNGLANHALDPSWHPDPPVMFEYPVPPPAVPKPTRVNQARDALSEAIAALGQAAALLDDVDEKRVVARKQRDEIRQLRRATRDILDALPNR